jgi:hypothetical protein
VNTSTQFLEKWAKQRDSLENQLPLIEAYNVFKDQPEIERKLIEVIMDINLEFKSYDTLTR